MKKTSLLFMEDAYLDHCTARLEGVTESGGLIFDQSVFYAQSGGQPGDSGHMRFDDKEIEIENMIYDRALESYIHIPSPSSLSDLPSPGTSVGLHLNWARRYAHMRMHSCLHLLCSLIPYPVSGGHIGEESGRLDFDIIDSSAINKEDLTSALNRLICADHRVYSGYILTSQLRSNMEMIRTMAVKPPMDGDRVRLIHIGEEGHIDIQPCGGTHIRSTGEIGAVYIRKIEKKGRHNRRIRLSFGSPPE